jgi:quercetin dioxygenase-like cupin family protein
MMKATGVEFSRRPPAAASDWHVGPRRQFVITLSGRAELEVAGGKKVAVGPGHINLIEDTTGKGHITHNLGPDDRIVVTIPLAN